MEPEGSLCSQDPATSCYPKPDASSLHFHTLFISLRFIVILSTHLHLGLLSGLFRFSNQNIVCISPMHATCPACLILELITLIIFSEACKL